MSEFEAVVKMENDNPEFEEKNDIKEENDQLKIEGNFSWYEY